MGTFVYNSPTIKVAQDVVEVMQNLKALKIDYPPNFHTLTSDLACDWHLFLMVLVPAMERGDLEHARATMSHLDLPVR